MSTGITVDVKNKKADIGGYYQNFAEEFDDLASFLKDDGCDLISYLFCPNSAQSEEDIREWFEYEEDVTEERINEAIAYNKLITTDTYHPIKSVIDRLTIARDIAATYGDERFHHGREALLSDIDELLVELKKHEDSDLDILFFRG
jgi:hypothetical protein